uniref:CRIB domain-containing protein n=1 Tax=Populus davidiana TaxID=266767 RepID=A0A6M2EZA3_9ROSI
MRDRMERLVLLPFSIGCVSESSVAIGVHQAKRAKTDTNLSASRTQEEDEESSSSTESTKNSLKLLAPSKPNVSTGFNKLVKGLKTFPQLFAYKEEMEELEVEMEIGLPTNVKHVTHIGWDDSPNTNPVQGWDSLISTDLLSLQSATSKQFELAIATGQANSPLVRASSA